MTVVFIVGVAISAAFQSAEIVRIARFLFSRRVVDSQLTCQSPS